MARRNATKLTAAMDGLAALTIAVAVVIWANQQRMPQGGLAQFLEMRITLLNASFSIVFAVLWKECMAGLGLYRGSYKDLRLPVLVAGTGCGLMTVVLALYLELRHAQGPVGRILAAFFVTAFVYEMVRLLVFNPRLPWRTGELEQIIIVGSGRRAAKAWRELRLHYHHRKQLLGFVDDQDPTEMSPDIAGRFLCRIDQLPDFLLRNVVDEMVVAIPMRSCYDVAQRAVYMAESAGVRVMSSADIYSLQHSTVLRARAPQFIELVPKDEKHLAAETMKRLFDFCIAGAGLVLLSPLLIAIALAIVSTSPGPVFFIQERCGYRRRRFPMWKFRSMVVNAAALLESLENRNEANGPIFKIKDDPRITPIGRVLRRTSLDELPQLWNVLLGDMSLVGPRPMSVRDVSLFSEAQLMRRFSVRPGITGSWQVAGRSSLSFDQWVTLDSTYIDQWSLSLDFKILAKTVPAVLKRSGAV
jgi:exopolysaccharide biosynthesis polyprenyl glycosylphosphotransferase